MGRIVITQNITVDGVVEATDDWFSSAGSNEEADAALAQERDASDGFLVGRQTFLDMRRGWRDLTDDTTGVTEHLNQVRKYVVSSTLTDPDWRNTEILSGDLATDVGRVRSAPGGDVVCTGSITLCRGLLDADLVDELRLYVFPYARGSGRRLFDGTVPRSLTLATADAFANGVVRLVYRTT